MEVVCITGQVSILTGKTDSKRYEQYELQLEADDFSAGVPAGHPAIDIFAGSIFRYGQKTTKLSKHQSSIYGGSRTRVLPPYKEVLVFERNGCFV